MNKKEKDSFEFIKNKNLLPFHLKEDLEKSNFLVIFVNQRSGSQEGTIIMELAKKYHHSSIKDFNIFVKDYLNIYKSNNIKIIIGGGDGTILRLIEELKKNDIIMERCIFGSMPLGTGNDLSNSLGFGAEVNINYSINRLQKILYNYLIAKIIKIDIWELNIIIKENIILKMN